MKSLPKTSALINVARRTVWFKDPQRTLEHPVYFLTYLMVYGSYDDISIVRNYVALDEFRKTLDQAPAGVFDPRSWTYWNLICGRYPAPPMPNRTDMLERIREIGDANN